MMNGCCGTLKSVQLNKLVYLGMLITYRRNKSSPIDFDQLKNLSSQPSYSQELHNLEDIGFSWRRFLKIRLLSEQRFSFS